MRGSWDKIMIDRNMNVLVVDDFPVVRKILRRILKGLGLTNIHEAEGGRNALKKVARSAGGPDSAGLKHARYFRH